MKKIKWITGIFLAAALMFCSCEDYLDKTPDADVTEKDVFGTYEAFQGFADALYGCIFDPNSHALTTGSENGDHSISFEGWSSARKYALGNYWELMDRLHSFLWSSSESSVFNNYNSGPSGVWPDGWRGIRVTNIMLEKLSLLNGTQEQKDLLEGQTYFFRAYLHWEIITRWGGVPYVDQVFSPTDIMTLPRLTFQEVVERIVEDLDRAISLLPDDWDKTEVGSRRAGFNTGRATKGAAMAYKAKALLYAGSPLMVKDGGGDYVFDLDYMKRSASAAWDVIQLANAGVYSLVPFADFQRNFATNDGTIPWTSETIWAKIPTSSGSGTQIHRHGRLYTPARFGGNSICETPVQNMVDAFEMENGLPIDDPASGYDEMDPWSNRDPRFRQTILVDGDLAGIGPTTKVELFEGGIDKKEAGVLTSYLMWKYWPKGANNIDQLWAQFRYATPLVRLADIYLMYAEAVNEAYGPSGTAEGSPLTAIEAVNIVRARANMPPVHSKFTGSQADFRERIRNERSVELCFEGSRWHDMRRWYIAHLPEYKVQYDLEFDKDHTSFKRVVRFNRVFDQKHYWVPFPRSQTQLYPQWPQNPGW